MGNNVSYYGLKEEDEKPIKIMEKPISSVNTGLHEELIKAQQSATSLFPMFSTGKESHVDLSPVLPLDNSNILSRPIIKVGNRRLPQKLENDVPEKIPDFIKYGTKYETNFEKEMIASNKRRISNEIELIEDRIRDIDREISANQDVHDNDTDDIRIQEHVIIIKKLLQEKEELSSKLTGLKNQFGSKRKKLRRSKKVKTSRKKSRKVNKRRRSRK